MDTTALMKMDETAMIARIAQAKFPKDLTLVEKKLMAEVSISYGLDPLMQELMIYQGNPYPTINARYRKAQESGKFDGIDTRPATQEERIHRHAKEGDYLYRCEVWVKGSSHAFVGWGRVRASETNGDVHLPIVKDPDRQAEKRAEAMGLRKAFSMPLPFQSWEEFEEHRAEAVIDVPNVGKVSLQTGEIEGEATELPEETTIEERVKTTKSIMNLEWLKESMKTLQEKGVTGFSEESLLDYMRLSYKGVKGDTVKEMASKLDKGQVAFLVKVIQDELDKL